MFIEEKENGIAFKVFVQPKSSRNAIVGLHGDALKVKLTAPPVEGAANAMCIQFFSKMLGVSKSAIEIQSGHASRTKILWICCGPTGRGGHTEQDRILALLKKLAVP
ncbi:DUF167 domain-containing protein [Desulfococcus sp.]|uniref:DUF167 domain-containing protein n=1 Tax=Desulfococcus sp. TaxID=2025834 RepID=UPI003594287E